jgi:hypothetical protein
MGHLRIIESFRLLLEYINQSLVAVVPFLLVTFVMLFAFALAYCFKEEGALTSEGFKLHFNDQYRALHGNFSEGIIPEESLFDFTMFFALTMLQPLILMNLLIAIIAVAHGRIEDARHRVSYHQLNFMILENEIFMPWNRKKNERGHMVTAQYENDESVSW